MLEQRFVDTVLGTIRVQISPGEGDAIVLWPSLLMTGELWAGQVEHFGGRHRLVLIDPPGHGGSQPLRAGFSFADCAQCVVDLLDGVGVDKAHFVGNSWGGMIGATFAALHPDRVGSAILMNCTASQAGQRQKFQYTLMLQMARVLGGIRPPLTRSALKAFLGPTTMRTREQVVSTVRSALQSVDIDSAAWAVRSVVPARPDQHDLLGRIATPVLVVAGAEDATFPVSETRRMADAIPGAQFVVLDGIAHLSALEAPERVNRLIDEFLFA